MFYDSWCSQIDPITFSDGRIFLGSTILSADLSTAVPIDLSNVDGKACYFAEGVKWDFMSQILLKDDNILFLTLDQEWEPVSFMFEGNSFRLTKYQPPKSSIEPTVFYDTQGRVTFFGGSWKMGEVAFNEKVQFKY